MIVDIGYERTNITLVHEGIPFLHRSIKAGGATVTAMMAKQMGISAPEAEQMKLDLAQQPGGELPPVLKEAMMPILHEVKYSLSLYAQQEFHEHSDVEKIIVTGGSGRLPQIDLFLKEALDINVYLGDPWARIAAPSGLRPVLDEIGPRFSVALGLAMKDSAKK
jgi:Tfp pilus assembly PilM family ATPase